jgi:hypothetical protein
MYFVWRGGISEKRGGVSGKRSFALKERHQCHPERMEGFRDDGDYL